MQPAFNGMLHAMMCRTVRYQATRLPGPGVPCHFAQAACVYQLFPHRHFGPFVHVSRLLSIWLAPLQEVRCKIPDQAQI